MVKKIVLTILFICAFALGLILFKSPKYVNLFGEKYLSNIENLDVSKVENISINELQNSLSKFSHLKEIEFGNHIISKYEKDKLIKDNSGISINVTAEIELYGKKYLENIKKLNLSKVTIDENLGDYLSMFPYLEYVNLNDQKISLDKKLLLIERYPNIDFDWKVEVGGKTVSNKITELDLDNVNIKSVDTLKKELKLLSKLTYLNMGNSNLSNEELDSIRNAFPNIKVSWIIHFGKWYIRTDDVAFSVLITDYTHKRLKSEDLDFLKYCKDLQALDLGHQSITDITPITDNLPNLRILILADNKISDISSIGKLKHLHYLELFMNKITDFSPLSDLKEIVDLNICYNKSNDVSKLMDFPMLERLWLVANKVTNEDFKKLESTYPNATIIRYSVGSTESGWRTHIRYYEMIKMYRKRNYISEEFTKYDR